MTINEFSREEIGPAGNWIWKLMNWRERAFITPQRKTHRFAVEDAIITDVFYRIPSEEKFSDYNVIARHLHVELLYEIWRSHWYFDGPDSN
jgi:hypothetical protein